MAFLAFDHVQHRLWWWRTNIPTAREPLRRQNTMPALEENAADPADGLKSRVAGEKPRQQARGKRGR